MIQISIQEQKDYLKEQLFIESLTANELNKEAIQKFSASKKVKGLEKYLKTQAWKEDNEGSTKVYLVRDKQTHDIVFFFALNVAMEKYNNLRFPLGFYVFWEIVINKVLEITQLLGCRYLYLFAADNSDHMGNINSVQNVLYDLDEEEVVPTYELVEYYKNELKFQEIQSLAILKAHYDFQCFSLYQPINQLINNRKLSWIQHSDFDE